MRKILSLLGVTVCVVGTLVHFTAPAGAVSTGVVISQVYGGGGNASATYQNDFVELFNRGTAPVDITGWTVQYATSAQSTAWTPIATLSGILQPGQYYLVGEAGGATGAVLPAADASGTTNMNQTNAKVALVSSGTALPASSTGCPTSSAIVDIVGYGTNGIVCAEGAAAGTLSSSKSATRAAGGCTDTDNNSTDFAVVTPVAHNKTSTLNVCGGGDAAPSVSNTTPAAGANNISVNAAIVVNFSESVSASSSAFSLQCPSGISRAFSQSASPASSFTLTPTSPLPDGTTCAVKVTAGAITDTDTIDPPDTMASDFNFSFTTASAVNIPPSVISTSPANATANVPVASPVVVNFSESVTASPSAFSIQCPVGTPQAFGQSASPATSYTLTPSASLPYGTTCTVSVAANQISDSDLAGLTSNVTFSFMTAAAPPPGAGKVMINEVDADTPGSDTAEFIELYDGGSGNTPLDGLVVVLFDGTTTGSGNKSYATFDLSGYVTDANGYFVLGNPGVPSATLVFDPGPFGLLQNGPDAVALYLGKGTDFPDGTTLTTANLQDAIVYGTDDFSATGLLPLLNSGQKIVNEDATGNSQTQSSQRCPVGMGGFRNTSEYYPGTPTPGAANTCPAPRPPSDVVISQIYGGGGNSGATFQNDYVELHNRGAATVDLTGWSLQYSSATGSSWNLNTQPLGGVIGAGQYYLIELASGGAAGSPLPVSPNIISQINIAAGSGNVALVNSYTGLAGACPIYDPTLVDLVGYGTADCGEGSTTAAALSNTTAIFRKNSGNQDTDNNANDFGVPTVPSPRRDAPIVELGPAVLTTDPPINGTDEPRDATILVTFTEAVNVDSGWISVTCASSGPHSSATFAASRGGQDQYVTPNVNFTPGEQCSATILGNHVHDVDTDDSAPNTDTLVGDYSWSFTVATGAAPPFPSSVHLMMGFPAGADSDPSHYLMQKPEYALSYNRDLGRPNWVSWHLSNEWTGTLTRADTFRPDPQVPPDWYRVQSFDFSGSGFDRGHMTPNADRDNLASIPINQATFLMSNMVAQAPGNNQGPWAALESYLRTLTDPTNTTESGNNDLFIVSGPFGEGGTGSNGGVTNKLATNHVSVPASTWKVALVVPRDPANPTDVADAMSRVNCSTRTIAVIMPNDDGIRPNPWQNYLTTVDAVQDLTGFDFYSNLPAPYQQCIEAGKNGVNPSLVKGNQTITFAQPPDRFYGDAPFVVSATGGASGNPVTFTASGACTSTGSFGTTITIVAPGSCTITASQAGTDIYNAAANVTDVVTVAQATPTVAVTGGSFTYDGSPHAGTCAVTGIGGESLPGVLSYAPGSDAPTAAGTYTVSCAFTGTTNYAATTETASLTIAPGSSFVTVSCPSGPFVYNAAAQTPCTATVTGAGGLGQTVAVSYANNVNAGTATASASFADGNHTGSNGSASFTIGRATPTVVATGGAFTYDGLPHAAACVVTGIGSDVLTGTIVYTPGPGVPTAVGTYTATCTSGATTNYAAAMATAAITIADKTAPVLSLPPDAIVTATSPAGAAFSYTASATDDVDHTDPVACTPPSGSTFPVGMTTVNCTAHDAAGNVVNGSFHVVVKSPTNAAEMVGAAEIATAAGVRNQFAFAVLEHQTGSEAGAIEFTRLTPRAGRGGSVLDAFISTLVTSVAFYNAPGSQPGRAPLPTIDQVTFSGVGRWNGRSGYTFTAQALDAGEPGRGRDQFAITIRDASGAAVATVNGTITAGNIDSLRVAR